MFDVFTLISYQQLSIRGAGGDKKHEYIFVDYSLLPVSCFRKASFLEKPIQSDHGVGFAQRFCIFFKSWDGFVFFCSFRCAVGHARAEGRIYSCANAGVEASAKNQHLVTLSIERPPPRTVSSALLPSVCPSVCLVNEAIDTHSHTHLHGVNRTRIWARHVIWCGPLTFHCK